MDTTTILSILLTPITGIASYLVGRRKRDNDFLQQLQNSINMLSKENASLLQEVVGVKRENAELKIQLGNIIEEKKQLEVKIERLERLFKNIKK